MEYLIRPCEPADLPGLVALCEKHAAYERASYVRSGKADRLHDFLFSSDPAVFCLVVESERQLIGYTSYTFNFSTWEAGYYLHMDCLFLEQDFRGQGIGAALVNELIRVAKEKNCVNMQWQTPAFNEGAIRFYKRLGAVAREKQRFTLGREKASLKGIPV